MDYSHTQKGDIAEYKFIVYCLEHNIPISKPVSNNLPYDCIIDLNGKLLKIQIKAGYKGKSDKTFVFNTKTTSKNYNEIVEKDYTGLIDGFITWYSEIPNKFFYLPVSTVTKGSMVLYYGESPKANQNYAFDFDFDLKCDIDVMVA